MSDSAPLSAEPGGARPRYALVDAARGSAIIAMVVFHIAWDLYYLGFIQVDVSTDPFWTSFQKAIVSSFLFLAGVSLWLGHGRGLRWRSFWRREAVLVGAALAVSLGTWLAFGDYFAFFGILHALALFSVLGLAFLRLPAWVTAMVGVAVIAAPGFVTLAVMRERWLAWIGFWPEPPPTADIVPLFPWLGVLLLGVAAAKWLSTSPVWTRPAPKWLAWLGRWSLVIYLLHQPILYGSLLGLSLLLPATDDARRNEAFVQSCRATQIELGVDAVAAERYCGCALEQVIQGDMWAMLERERSAAEELELGAMTRICQAMSATPIPDVPAPALD